MPMLRHARRPALDGFRVFIQYDGPLTLILHSTAQYPTGRSVGPASADLQQPSPRAIPPTPRAVSKHLQCGGAQRRRSGAAMSRSGSGGGRVG